MKNNAHIDTVVEEVRSFGYAPSVLMGAKHPFVEWEMAGRRHRFTVPGTPSDSVRGALNSRADVRKLLLRYTPVESAPARIPNVIVTNGQIFATSLDVADYFERRHDHVLGEISKLLKKAGTPKDWFTQDSAPDGNGISRRTYLMTRNGFSLLGMGFTGDRALAFKVAWLEAFERVEAELISARQIPIVHQDTDVLARKLLEMEDILRTTISRLGVLEANERALEDLVLTASQPTLVEHIVRRPRPQFIRPSLLRRGLVH